MSAWQTYSKFVLWGFEVLYDHLIQPHLERHLVKPPEEKIYQSTSTLFSVSNSPKGQLICITIKEQR